MGSLHGQLCDSVTLSCVSPNSIQLWLCHYHSVPLDILQTHSKIYHEGHSTMAPEDLPKLPKATLRAGI